MTSTGAIIFATMGSICMGIAGTGASWAMLPLIAGAAMVWLTLMAAALLLRKREKPRAPEDAKRIDRLVTYASIGEGVAIFVGINVVVNLGHPEWTNPVIIAVVGLHFVPLAWKLPAHGYFVTGAALLGAAAAGLAVTDPHLQRLTVFCLAATVLWATSAYVLLRVNSRV